MLHKLNVEAEHLFDAVQVYVLPWGRGRFRLLHRRDLLLLLLRHVR